MCDVEEGDPPDLWKEEWRRSRRKRRCEACQETISPGEDYHRCFYIAEGRGWTWVHCARCRIMVEALYKHRAPEEVALGLDCGELWTDTIGELPDEIAALAFALPGELGRPLEKTP